MPDPGQERVQNMKKNMLVVHGGAPTAVLNASLFGVLKASQNHPMVDHIYGARYGTEGLLKGDLIDLTTLSELQQSLLLQTPGTAIGTSRTMLQREDYQNMARQCYQRNIGYVLFSGGNGTMEACSRLADACDEIMDEFDPGASVRVAGIPKTIDNDLALTDHSPGFGSAARFIVQTVREIATDVRSLPIHVSIVEIMGRNAGWLTAASALARSPSSAAPHLIYLPERPFNEKEFLEDVKRCHERYGGVVVAVSEGLKRADGQPIVPPIFQIDRSVYFGDVGAYLAELVIKELHIKARSEKPGIAGRSSIALQSSVDREEAVLAGQTAAEAVLAGTSKVMVGFQRVPGTTYQIRTKLLPVGKIKLTERIMPDEYINIQGNDVTVEFCEWCQPLLGEPLPDFLNLLSDN